MTNSWTAFVEYKKSQDEDLAHLTFSDLVSHCTFELHETYKDADKVKRVDVKKGFNEVHYGRTAWGYFDLPIIVYFKKETGIEPFRVEPELSFDGNGDWKTYKIPIKVKNLLDGLKKVKPLMAPKKIVENK